MSSPLFTHSKNEDFIVQPPLKAFHHRSKWPSPSGSSIQQSLFGAKPSDPHTPCLKMSPLATRVPDVLWISLCMFNKPSTLCQVQQPPTLSRQVAFSWSCCSFASKAWIRPSNCSTAAMKSAAWVISAAPCDEVSGRHPGGKLLLQAKRCSSEGERKGS